MKNSRTYFKKSKMEAPDYYFCALHRFFIDFDPIQHIFQCLPSAGVYLLKVNNGNCRAMSEFCQ